MISHEGLTMWVELLTLAGGIITPIGALGIRGWLKAAELEKQRYDEKLEELGRQAKAQWGRLDELKQISTNFVHRDYLDEAIKKLADSNAKAIADLSSNLTTAINHLTERLDRMVDHR